MGGRGGEAMLPASPSGFLISGWFCMVNVHSKYISHSVYIWNQAPSCQFFPGNISPPGSKYIRNWPYMDPTGKETPRKLKKQWRGLVPWSLHLEWAVDLFSKCHGSVVGEMVKHRWGWMIKTKSCPAIPQKPVGRCPWLFFDKKLGVWIAFTLQVHYPKLNKKAV